VKDVLPAHPEDGDTVQDAVGAQSESDGGVAEQAPEHPYVPVFVMPQEFGADWHEVPYPGGFAGGAGVDAEHAPLQPMVP